MILLDIGGHSGFWQRILEGDHWLFSRINQHWTNPFFDTLFIFMREAELWVPFYLFLLVFITLNFARKGWFWSLFLIMTAIISDLVSSSLIKNWVSRLRPCHDPFMADSIRVLAQYCPFGSSFTSSHACNHFAMATFIFLTLRQTSRWWWLIYAWAFLISYAQVYVGVHFPTDILCGGILGSMIGYGTGRLFQLQFGSLNLTTYNHTHA